MKKEVEYEITNNFLQSLFSTPNGKSVLRSLLTPTERTMLAKRLALIMMLSKNDSYYKISKNLKVSTSTIKRIHRGYNTSVYDPIKLALRSRSKKVWLELLMAILAPHSMNRAKHAEIRKKMWDNLQK